MPSFLGTLTPDWAGLSLTMPLKTAVLELLDQVDPLAREVAAVNTVLCTGGRRVGHNTDIAGMVAALAEVGVHRCERPVVLGGGATARSALAALRALGAEAVTVVVRSEAAETLVAGERMGLRVTVAAYDPRVTDGCDLLVSTLPAGATAGLEAYAREVPALLDVVYAPWPTPLALACRGAVAGGAAMLLHQAATQVTLMTGRPAPLEAMRSALAAV